MMTLNPAPQLRRTRTEQQRHDYLRQARTLLSQAATRITPGHPQNTPRPSAPARTER